MTGRAQNLVAVHPLRAADLVTAGTILQDTRKPLRLWFRATWHVTSQKNGASALGLQRVLGLGSFKTAWTWLHKLRRVMVPDGSSWAVSWRSTRPTGVVWKRAFAGSLLKRWMLGTHQGAISHEHLDYYLPLPPPQLTQPWQTLLPARAAGVGG